MKTCPNCQTTYPDTSSFCNACASPLVPVQRPASAVSTKLKESKFSLIMNFVFKVLAIISATFSGCALASISVKLLYMGYEINSYSDLVDSIRCRVRPDESCTIIAIVLAALSLAIAITLLVCTLVKQRNCKEIFSAVTRFLIGGGLLAVAIVIGGGL